MQNKLIKYLEENFNAEINYKLKNQVYLHSDLLVSDLPKIVKEFKGVLIIDDDGDALVDKYDNLCLHIMYDGTTSRHTFSDNPYRTLTAIHTIL